MQSEDAGSDPPPVAPSPPGGSPHGDSMAARSLESLPERWRTVLWRTDIELESPLRVSILLDLAPHDVITLASRAREGLRETFLHTHLEATVRIRCREALSRLGMRARGQLSADEAMALQGHLSSCDHCAPVAADLDRLATDLRGMVATSAPAATAPTATASSAAVPTTTAPSAEVPAASAPPEAVSPQQPATPEISVGTPPTPIETAAVSRRSTGSHSGRHQRKRFNAGVAVLVGLVTVAAIVIVALLGGFGASSPPVDAADNIRLAGTSSTTSEPEPAIHTSADHDLAAQGAPDAKTTSSPGVPTSPSSPHMPATATPSTADVTTALSTAFSTAPTAAPSSATMSTTSASTSSGTATTSTSPPAPRGAVLSAPRFTASAVTATAGDHAAVTFVVSNAGTEPSARQVAALVLPPGVEIVEVGIALQPVAESPRSGAGAPSGTATIDCLGTECSYVVPAGLTASFTLGLDLTSDAVSGAFRLAAPGFPTASVAMTIEPAAASTDRNAPVIAPPDATR